MKFLYNAPAIFHKDAIIVGDTHFGMESRLRRKGIYDEKFSERLFEKLKSLILEYNAKKLILLGDVKEDITTLDSYTANILAKLSLVCEVIIVRGNHDGGIDKAGSAKIIPSDGFVYEGLGLTHGHSWPSKEVMNAEYIISGHQHPMLATVDSFGKKRTEPAWFFVPLDSGEAEKHYKQFNPKIQLILMPAFNPIVGSVVNSDEKERIGPLINNKIFKLDHALVYRLDGTCLGKLKDIQ